MTPSAKKADEIEKSLLKKVERLTETIAGQAKTISTQKRKMGELANRADIAERNSELAERQSRSISTELGKARRRIAELESLIGGTLSCRES
ncbi:putative nucleic acid-binding Zn-ribbon protein [Novosphingobium sp. SG751A]|uniref:hypothetical protein n=1 Tax=Novosphingobium sp. SG751A TaxID=2587000 RepID=UPI001558162B|nr:hypothetical protein [Novosphingobium sp. SG751A]NOW46220.1 putative nucleic acid-binding Zn-ribbon protein [Novosphingobium sp. SG751A]